MIDEVFFMDSTHVCITDQCYAFWSYSPIKNTQRITSSSITKYWYS